MKNQIEQINPLESFHDFEKVNTLSNKVECIKCGTTGTQLQNGDILVNLIDSDLRNCTFNL